MEATSTQGSIMTRADSPMLFLASRLLAWLFRRGPFSQGVGLLTICPGEQWGPSRQRSSQQTSWWKTEQADA